MKKRWCSVLLAVVMTFSMLIPFGAMAADMVTLHDETSAPVTLKGATGQYQNGAAVYQITSDPTQGSVTYTFAQDFSGWSSGYWQDKMWLHLSGKDMTGGDGIAFTVTASSETVAKQVAEVLNLEFRISTGDENGYGADIVTTYATPSEDTPYTYFYRVPYSAFVQNGAVFKPTGTDYFLTVTFYAESLSIQNESVTFSSIYSYCAADTQLEMDEKDTVTIHVSTENGGKADASIAYDALDSRSYARFAEASLQMHRDSVLTLTADAVNGKKFERWQNNGTDFSDSAQITIQGADLSDGAVFTALYEDAPAEPEDITIFTGQKWTTNNPGAVLQLDLEKETLINRVKITEPSDGAVQTFHIEVLNGENWENVYDNDYIQPERGCILPEDVTTTSVRLVIDSLNAEVSVTDFSADYQKSTENPDFMNVGYASHQWYEMGWDGFRNTKEQLNSMTDLIMIGNYTFDMAGKFGITKKKGETITYSPDSDEAVALMNGWVETLKGASTNLAKGKTRLWFSLTHNNARLCTAFLDETTRTEFAKAVTDFALQYGMYGVDVDWEYPESSDSLRSFRLMLKALADELHAAGLKLSCTLSPFSTYLTGTEFRFLDYVSYMSYTNIVKVGNSGRSQIPYNRLLSIIKDCTNRGCAANKIWIGLPYFGKPDGQPAATFSGLYQYYKKQNGDETFPKGLNVIEMPDDKGNIYPYYYNGAYLLQDKVALAVEKGCGGVMSWWSGQDIKVFGDGETAEMGGVTARAEDSLVRTVYEAVKRFTGVDPLHDPADYTAVDEALQTVPNDLTYYTKATADALEAAVAAVEYGLLSDRQAEVDAMAQAVKDAVAGLKERQAGDLDGNDEVTVTDALEALRAAVGLKTPTDGETQTADLDHSGKIDVTDALKILRIAVGLDR